MLTEKEQKELNLLRHDSETLKNRIFNLETDLDNTEYEIACLDKWKSGRWIGFVIMLIFTIICMAVESFYVVVRSNSIEEKIVTKSAAIDFAVSATALAFFTTLLVVVTIVTIRLGIRCILEVGNSEFSRKMALSVGVKNYYNRVEYHIEKKYAIQKELLTLKRDKNEIDRRLNELEKDEQPWESEY